MVTKADEKQTVEIIKTEVENYLVDVVRENERLQRKLDHWEAE